MSYYTPAVDQLLSNRLNRDDSKTLIKSIRKDVPVLSAIVDYGGESTIDQILNLQQQDKNQKCQNSFQKILQQAKESPSESSASKRCVSFLDYKAKPIQTLIQQHKQTNNKKKLKTSIVVQVPSQLQQMKKQILLLPSLGQSRLTGSKNSVQGTSRLLEDFKKAQSRRYQTQCCEGQTKTKSLKAKKKYLNSIRNIFTQFQSPQINCNGYILGMHKACKNILEQEKVLERQYKTFESLGSPPNRIIQLKKLLYQFQNTMDRSLDADAIQQINNMSSKRYDTVLKHEQEARRLNMAKFQQKKKLDKIQTSKNAQAQKQILSNKIGFKLNSKGELIYFNKNKGNKG